MAFNLMDVLKDAVPDSGTGRDKIEYLDLTLLDDDPNNFYELRDLDALADNIAICGLQQPIRARPHPETEGRYMIVSGHRRRAAVAILAAEDPEKWTKVPCIVDRDDVSPNLRQLALIFANSNTRALTSAELSKQAIQVETYLRQLEEEGFTFPGRMRDKVAEIMSVSKTKLGNLKVIREKLIPMWNALFDKDQIGESLALALARLPMEWQDAMYNEWGKRPKMLYTGHVQNVQDKIRKIEKMKCRAYNNSPCRPQLERIKRICALGQYDSSCAVCCLDCGSLVDCQNSCSCAAMKKATLIQRRKDDRKLQKQEEKERTEPILLSIRGLYARWAEAIARKGMSAEEYLRACGVTYLGSAPQDFEKFASDPESIKSDSTRLPFSRFLQLSDVKSLLTAADVLDCSLGWLLGRDVPGPGEVQNESAPATGWRTDDPVEPGEYAVLTRPLASSEAFFGDTRKWDGFQWEQPGWDDNPVVYWMPLPEA